MPVQVPTEENKKITGAATFKAETDNSVERNYMKNYMELKSGSDVRGYASDIFDNTVDLTEEAVYDIAAAFVPFLSEKAGKDATELTVSVGHDSRITAEKIKTQVIAALKAAGVKVYDCGLSSTPSMFMTTVHLGCDGAIQITASHHPADRNGLKFFLPTGGLDPQDISEILTAANNGEKAEVAEGIVEKIDFMSQYSAILRKLICDELGVAEEDKPLKDYHIVVDAGNGAGGFYADKVLAPLGADVSGSVYLEPDGMFPNHIPNPENAVAMAHITDAVLNANADLGVIFDTDVDRAACVDPDGVEINRNRLVALAAAIALEKEPGSTIVTDSVTSAGLKTFIEETLGGKHHRFKRGYKNVINEAVRLCNEGVNAPLAIETSGHAALKENYFLDDGAYLVTKIIIKMAKLGREGKNIFDLTADLKTPAEEKEMRFNIMVDEFRSYGECVIEGLQRWCEAFKDKGFKIADDNHEGIRVSVLDGWFLLRLSVHDPVMPMNVESDSKDGCKKIVELVADFFRNCQFLDCSAMENFLEEKDDE